MSQRIFMSCRQHHSPQSLLADTQIYVACIKHQTLWKAQQFGHYLLSATSICGTPCGRSLISLPWPSLQPLPWQASSWQACLQLQRAWQEPSLPCLQLPWAFSWALCRLGLHHPPPLDAAKLPVTYILQIKGRHYAFFFLLHASILLRSSVCHTSNSIPAWLTEHALFRDG